MIDSIFFFFCCNLLNILLAWIHFDMLIYRNIGEYEISTIQSNYYIEICISKRVRTISTQYLVLSHYYSCKSDKQKYLTASFINVFLFRNISRDFNADTEIHPTSPLFLYRGVIE